jgi:hypothetical protein
MRNINLEIAGYKIGFQASSDGPELAVSQRFLRYLKDFEDPDIRIIVHSGGYSIPASASRVFHAPFVEEIDGKLVETNPDFWSVWSDDPYTYIKTSYPLSPDKKNGLLKFSLSENEWHLWIDGNCNEVDPAEYPLDGLILYYLTTLTSDIFIHAAGVSFNGKGLLFTGISGKGKSTMAGLWKDYGAGIIHDDRLIIRKSGNNYLMFNTPVYENECPMESVITGIYIIEHGRENNLIPLKDSSSVSQVMSNCIQHSWDASMISRLLGSVSDLCSGIPVYSLSFRPDASAIEYILNEHE